MTALRFFVLVFLAMMLSPFAGAQDFETPAPYAVIMDGESGVVLFEKNAREPIGPSSMTKIMTAEIVFSRLKDGSLTLDQTFPVSETAWRKGGSKMFVEVGTDVRVEDLLRGIIIQSGNDACIVVAEGISGSESAFAALMTRRARELGLETANFKNASGWPEDGHVISVMDLARLARHIIETYPEYYPLYAETEFRWSGITQPNRNPLLGRSAGADGMKTGHTEDNGYGLVGTAERDGRRVIIVVNGLTSETERRNESLRLIDAGFQSFDIATPYRAGDIVATAPVWIGRKKEVGLALSDDVTLGFARSSASDIRFAVEYDGPIAAPIIKGDVVGALIITQPGRAERRVDLLAAEDVARKGLFGRIIAGLGPLGQKDKGDNK